MIGDLPYGDEKIAGVPHFEGRSRCGVVVHVGDIKSGGSMCTDEYFELVRDEFERLKSPVIYTPGDNEWTDCHRASNGNYQPTERLDALRSTFFPVSGETLGVQEKHVLTQADDAEHGGYVENVMWMESRVVFAALNVPGSNNDSPETNPWTGQWAGDHAQATEQAARDAANLAWLSRAFEVAGEMGALGVCSHVPGGHVGRRRDPRDARRLRRTGQRQPATPTVTSRTSPTTARPSSQTGTPTPRSRPT